MFYKKLNLLLLISFLTLSCNKFENKKILFYGDSQVSGYDTNYWFPEYKTYNKGEGGNIINGVISHIKQKKITADYLIIQIGTNDIRPLIFKNYKDSEIIDRVKKDLKKLFEQVSNLPELVLITSIIPLPKRNKISKYNYIFNELNNYIKRELVSHTNCIFINLYDRLTKEIFLRDEFTGDGLHLNRKGYQQLTYSISEKIN